MRKKLVLLSLTVLIMILTIWFVPPVYLLKSESLAILRRNRDQETLAIVGPKEKHWVPIERVSRFALAAIVVSEDARFYSHWGIDLSAIKKSFEVNWRKGRYARGASTITQQVVRMTLLYPDKTILRKIREITGALLLELLMSKKDILEWYVNLVPLGNGIYGLSEASRFYFASGPDILNVSQGILLAMVLPSPNKRSRSLQRKILSIWGQRRFADLAEKLYLEGYITKNQWEEAIGRGNFGAPIHMENTP